jgi:hypothetical protein
VDMDVRKFFIVILSSIMCCMVVAQSPKQQGSGGKLKFLNTSYVIGEVISTNNVEITFVNVGTEPVRIESVHPDCQCTKYELSRPELMPGDSAYITLFLNTENKLGPQRIYSVVKADTYERMYKLTLLVDVDVPLEIE